MQTQNRYLDFSIHPSFQQVNRLLVLSFENENDWRYKAILSFNCRNKRLQCYNQWNTFFDQPVKNDLRTYDNIRKIVTVQGDD